MQGEMQGSARPLGGDRLFHLRIAEATGNGALVAVVKMLWEERTGPLYQRLEEHYDSPGLWNAAMAEHRAVLKAIAARDPAGARSRDAAPPEPRLQAVFHRLGQSQVTLPFSPPPPALGSAGRAGPGGNTMLACRIHAKEDLRIEPVATPEPGPGEVLVQLGAGGICGSDLHYYFEGRNGSFVVREPLIPGHEASGVVAAVGPGVTRVKVGDRAAISPSHACGKCEYCRAGPRAPVHEHALPRQREPLPARPGDVPGILRDGRAADATRRPATSRWASSRSPSRWPSRCTRSTAASRCSASRCWSPAPAPSAA